MYSGYTSLFLKQQVLLRPWGQPLGYIDRPGSEGTLVYIHGIGCSSADFEEAARRPELGGYRLIALDLPGSGRSPYPQRGALDIPTLAGMVASFLCELDLSKVCLVAHSMGVIVALRLLEQDPSRIQSLICVEASNALWGPGTPFRARRIAKAGWRAFQSKGFDAFVSDCTTSENSGFRTHASILKTTSPRAFYDYSVSLAREADSGTLLSVYRAVPLARRHGFIYGADNPDTATNVDILYAQGIALYEVPGHHFPFYDNPDRYYETLARALRSDGTLGRS